ncbi:hypothetical protein [Arthrobacter sp. RIT-PI-e]|uniref:hypothetical protein n=1 Tax=Arthrobacter sp. RIT-PI-e TaxID=1681197 RepID=UPI000675BBC9
MIYLFAAGRSTEDGAVEWGADEIADDIRTVRARGQQVVLSTGGAGQGIDFSSRTVSRRFVDSVERINTELGGTSTDPVIDGVDFNTFEAELAPDTTEYLWMFRELKRRFGEDFGITSPPAPWNEQDRAMIREALSQGLMTYAAPQFYDGPGLSDPAYIVRTTREWVQDVAGGDASKIVVGFGMEDAENYSSLEQIRSAWRVIQREFPTIRGAFVWQHRTDSERGWAFADQVAPLVLAAPVPLHAPPAVPPPRPMSPPVPAVRIGGASYPLTGIDVPGGPDALVACTDDTVLASRGPYGCDVTVLDGRVTGVHDRRGGSPTGAVVPAGGFVLSGHGEARLWLLAHARIGETVHGIS